MYGVVSKIRLRNSEMQEEHAFPTHTCLQGILQDVLQPDFVPQKDVQAIRTFLSLVFCSLSLNAFSIVEAAATMFPSSLRMIWA